MEPEYFYKVAFVIAAMYITYKLFMSREKFYALNRATILLSVASSFFIPLIKLPFFRKEVFVDSDASVMNVLPAEMIDETENQLSISDIIPIVFAVGVVLFFIKYLVTTLAIIGKVTCSNKILLRKGIKLIISESIKTPVSWVRYIFMNSRDYQENSREVLTHEMAHIRHCHSFDLIFMDLACCLQWFNPAIWLFRKELRAVHEYQADYDVIASGFDVKNYQILLIKKAAGRKWSSVTSSLNHSNLKKRITMMSCKTSSRLAFLKILMPVAVSALLTLKFAESNAQTVVVTSSKDNHFNLEIQNDEQKPLVMIDGKKSSFESVQPSNVKSIRVLRDQPAKDEYGEMGANGVVEISTKDVDITVEESAAEETEKSGNMTVVEPSNSFLVIVDGEEGSYESVNSSDIKNISILKGQSAIDAYGEKAANGVVVVTTKKHKKSGTKKTKIIVKQNNPDSVTFTPEEKPEFPGGDIALRKFIAENVKYPEGLKDFDGTAYVKIIVDKNGKVTNPSILKSSGNELADKEALRVIGMLPDFIPGKKDGQPADVPISIPIKFAAN